MKKLELIQKKQEQKRDAIQQVKMNAPATSKTENRCNENYNNNPNENHVISDTISDAADEIKKGSFLSFLCLYSDMYKQWLSYLYV